MTALSVLIIYFGLYATVSCRSFRQKDGDEENFQPLCSRKCKGTPEESDNGTSLYYPCSCSKSCAVFGDCCYDSPYKSAGRVQQVDIISLSVVGRGRYQAVASCPPDRRSNFCKRSLGHQRPVTSKVTNITYGNIFCATCNDDDENLVSWNVELKCSSEIGKDVLTSSSQATKLIYSSDEFWKVNRKQQTKIMCKYYVHSKDFTVLDSLELRPFTTGRKISSCSDSWRDVTVAEKCKSYDDTVYFKDEAFKNLHCAICNDKVLEKPECIIPVIPSNVKNLCRGQRLENCNISVRSKGKDSIPSRSIYDIRRRACSSPLKFDPIRKGCFHVTKE